MKNNNVFCRLFLSFFFWPLHCQAYDLRLLITPLISLNFCCNQTAKTRPLIYCAKLMFFISPSSFSVISWLSDLLQRGVLINNDLISETRALVYIYGKLICSGYQWSEIKHRNYSVPSKFSICSICAQVIRYNLVWRQFKSISCSKTGYTSITCSKITNIPYNLIFTTKFNDFSILIIIISWHYLNLSLANEYVGNVTIPTQIIKYTA
jgi:hypothetical protein